MAKITWLGHACWLLESDGVRAIIDPFLTGNPQAACPAADVQADLVLVSHGHGDHCGDAAEIANRCGATLISVYEITTWFEKNHGVKRTIGMNLGGGVQTALGRIKLTIAWHSSCLPDGSYGGNPAGFLITLASGKKIYFACDTALFSDMRLIGGEGLELAVLPIGDLFTMGPDDALAAVKLLRPQTVLPSHFGAWPIIAQDGAAWAERVQRETGVRGVALQPGESLEI